MRRRERKDKSLEQTSGQQGQSNATENGHHSASLRVSESGRCRERFYTSFRLSCIGLRLAWRLSALYSWASVPSIYRVPLLRYYFPLPQKRDPGLAEAVGLRAGAIYGARRGGGKREFYKPGVGRGHLRRRRTGDLIPRAFSESRI